MTTATNAPARTIGDAGRMPSVVAIAHTPTAPSPAVSSRTTTRAQPIGPAASMPAPARAAAPSPARRPADPSARPDRASRLGLGEAISHAEDGLDVARGARIGLELAPDVLHVRVDRPLVRLERHAVDRVEQLGAREDPAR